MKTYPNFGFHCVGWMALDWAKLTGFQLRKLHRSNCYRGLLPMLEGGTGVNNVWCTVAKPMLNWTLVCRSVVVSAACKAAAASTLLCPGQDTSEQLHDPRRRLSRSVYHGKTPLPRLSRCCCWCHRLTEPCQDQALRVLKGKMPGVTGGHHTAAATAARLASLLATPVTLLLLVESNPRPF